MLYLATILLVAMTLGLVICAALLWKRHRETGDYSRIMLSVVCGFAALSALISLFRMWSMDPSGGFQYLDPGRIFYPVFFQLSFFLYPLSLLRLKKNRSTVYFWLFAPLSTLAVIGICSGVEYRVLESYEDIFLHISEFNVWLRLLVLAMVMLYGLALFPIPYNSFDARGERKVVIRYSVGYFVLAVLFVTCELSHSPVMIFVHSLSCFVFFIVVTRYDLAVRIVVPEKAASDPDGEDTLTDEDKLWESIRQVLDRDEQWRSPDLSLPMLTSKVCSNRTYVSEAFKRNTGMNFHEYISRRRIGYVTGRLKADPKADIRGLFFYVGYRSYSTAWDNFRRVTGMTLSEFLSQHEGRS